MSANKTAVDAVANPSPVKLNAVDLARMKAGEKEKAGYPQRVKEELQRVKEEHEREAQTSAATFAGRAVDCLNVLRKRALAGDAEGAQWLLEVADNAVLDVKAFAGSQPELAKRFAGGRKDWPTQFSPIKTQQAETEQSLANLEIGETRLVRLRKKGSRKAFDATNPINQLIELEISSLNAMRKLGIFPLPPLEQNSAQVWFLFVLAKFEAAGLLDERRAPWMTQIGRHKKFSVESTVISRLAVKFKQLTGFKVGIPTDSRE